MLLDYQFVIRSSVFNLIVLFMQVYFFISLFFLVFYLCVAYAKVPYFGRSCLCWFVCAYIGRSISA